MLRFSPNLCYDSISAPPQIKHKGNHTFPLLIPLIIESQPIFPPDPMHAHHNSLQPPNPITHCPPQTAFACAAHNPNPLYFNPNSKAKSKRKTPAADTYAPKIPLQRISCPNFPSNQFVGHLCFKHW